MFVNNRNTSMQNSSQSQAQTLNVTCKMNRYNFEPALALLIRGSVRRDSPQRNLMDKIIPNKFKSPIPSLIKRFIDTDCQWTPEQITRMLERETTQQMDAHIARLQKVIDDNAIEPGLSRKKEIRKEKARETASAILGPTLAARALSQLEHDLNLVMENGTELRDVSPSGTGLQYMSHTLYHHDKLMAARKQRIKDEERADIMAIKEFRARVKAVQKGQAFYGHWEFENEEEEALGRVFMRKTNHEGPITANSVFREQLAQEAVSVILGVHLKWVEEGSNGPGDGKRKKRKAKAGTAEDPESSEDWLEEGTTVPRKALPKKSLVVKLKVDFSRLNLRKRKDPPSSDATSNTSTKKQKKPTAMSNHPGFKGAERVEEDGEDNESSGLSDPPDSD